MTKKKFLIIHFNMELGGVETSLLGLLDTVDYDRFDVDLFLYAHEGVLMEHINPKVHLLPEVQAYRALTESVRSNWQKGFRGIAAARSFAKLRSCLSRGPLHCGHNYKQYFHKLCMPFLPRIDGEYDLAISFNDPHYIIGQKVSAKTKLSWFHTDASRITFCDNIEREMWGMSDYAVNVSESCRQAFDEKHPYMADRSIVIENILSKQYILGQSVAFDVSREMPSDGSVRLLSIGRFTHQKNFDQVPEITRQIRAMGIHVKWYLIGFGGDENLIRQKIQEAGMEGNVVILGKQENPYPYIKACDIYVQPSRFEGKSVAVREAQILNKPVVITAYATSGSQLRDGYDGVIVPMDNVGCAQGIAAVIRDEALRERLVENTKQNDYMNSGEVKKLYRLIEEG